MIRSRRSAPSRSRVFLLGLLISLVAVGLLLPTSAPTPAPIVLSVSQIAHDDRPVTVGERIVLLDLPDGWGSGTPVQSHPMGITVILTAKHVAEHMTFDGTTRAIQGERTATAVRAELHPDLDVALVWFAGDEFELVEIDTAPLAVGSRAHAVGWMFGQVRTIGEGLISNRDSLSVDIMPGCSGGAVLRHNRVVGVLAANIVVGGLPVGAVAIFVPISEIAGWLSGILN